MTKFLHAADIHLDSPLQKLAAYDHAPVEQIRNASRQALSSMVDLAIQENVDLVLIAGDLYDGNWNDQNTGLQFVKQAARLVDNGIPILVIRGNHDAENLMTTSLPLPSNPDGSSIMIASDRVETRRLPDVGLAIHAQSFATRSVTENLATAYPPPIAGLTNIGMLHTSLSGAEGHDTYSPCTAEYLTQKGYDYWALGHVHTRFDHAIGDRRVPVIFPGNLQGRHIRETGPKGCLIVEVDDSHRCQATFHALDQVRWERLQIDAAKIDHPDEIVDEYRRFLDEALQNSTPLLVTRVEIRGVCSFSKSLMRASRQTLADLRATAVAMADGRVWMEDYKVRVEASPSGTNVADSAPRQSLAAAQQELLSGADFSEILSDNLKALIKKMPAELSGDHGVLPLDDSQWTIDLIGEAAADLEGRIDA